MVLLRLHDVLNGLTRMSVQEARLACIQLFYIFNWEGGKRWGWWNQHDPPALFHSTGRFICSAVLHDCAHLVGASHAPGAADHLEEPDRVDGRRCAHQDFDDGAD